MSITRLWQAGAETGLDELSYSAGVALNFAARTGDRSFQIQLGIIERFAREISSMATTKQIRGGLAYVKESDTAGNDYEIFAVEDSSANRLFELVVDQSADELALEVATVQQDITTGGLWPEDIGTYKYITYDVKIDPTAGWIHIYLNGVEILSFTGNTGNADIDQLVFGTYTDAGGGNQYASYDDLYVDDTTGESEPTESPPIKKFVYLQPTSTGNYAQWVGSDADNVDNYVHIDEMGGYSDADYVEEDTVNQYDSYGMENYTLGAGESIVAVIPIVRAQRYGASEEIVLGTRYSSTDQLESSRDPGYGAFKKMWERQTTKPGGGAWDQTSLDGVELVIKSSGSF